MTTKITKTTARPRFRPEQNINHISQVEYNYEDYDYAVAIYTYREGSSRVDKALEEGWELVYTKETLKDDRQNIASQNTKEKLRPEPVVERYSDGHEGVLIRILKSKRHELDQKRIQKEKERYMNLVRGRQVVKRGKNEEFVYDPEINFKQTRN